MEVFEQLLGTSAHERGHHGAREVVVLGDGAPWIWNLFARQLPGAVQILDFYHACDPLSSVAEAIYGKGSDLSRAWQKARQAELKTDGVLLVLRAIFAWKPAGKEAHKLRRDTFGYFRRNAARMRYGTFLQRGYHHPRLRGYPAAGLWKRRASMLLPSGWIRRGCTGHPPLPKRWWLCERIIFRPIRAI